MPTTTIEITDTQKDVLDDLKVTDGEPYKSVIGRLIEDYDEAIADGVDEARVREIVRDMVILEALE